MKPIIGIISRPELSPSKHEIASVYRTISNAIIRSGAIPLGIIPTEDKFYLKETKETINIENFNDLKKVIDLCDGIICQGGDDFFDYDLKVIKYCYDSDIPLLGICLGMQTMGYLFKGKIENILNHYEGFHEVTIDNNSKLYKILKTNKLLVNTRHKSVLKKTDLAISAYSSDGFIEAIEDKTKKFFIGIQWHPETMNDKVIDELINNMLLE